MKIPKIITFLILTLIGASVVFAGGSSVGVYETDIRDKLLIAGENDQKLMSFTVEPWAALPGDLEFKTVYFHCKPGNGFSKAKLIQDGIELGSASFTTGLNLEMFAEIDGNDFIVPNGIATEFELVVDVDGNVGDFITSCVMDNIVFYNIESEIEYGANRINVDFSSDNLIYIDNPDVKSRNETVNILNEKVLNTPLESNSTDNKILEFMLNGPEDILVQDIFIHCTNSVALKNLKLKVDDNEFFTSYIDFNSFSVVKPTYIPEKKLIFSGIDKMIGYGSRSKTFELFGDSGTYSSVNTENIPRCEVSDVMAISDVLYIDINNNHKNIEAITYLSNIGIFEGYEDGSFKPENALNRAELVKIMIEAGGFSAPSDSYNNCFSDVSDEWFAPYVCYAKENGFIQGYPDGTFKPDQTVNRVEAIKIAIEVFGIMLPPSISSNPYPDTDKNHWYAPYVFIAREKGLFDSSMEFYRPVDGMQRGDVSDIIYRLLIIKEMKAEKYDDSLNN